MTVLLVALLVLAVVGLAVSLSDRTVARLAERKAAEYLAGQLGPGAHITVHGSPFLRQALRGRYGDIEVRAYPMRVGTLAGVSMQAHLVNALLPLRALLGRRVDELPVAHVHGHLVIPYDELARVSAVPGLRFEYRNERLYASAAVPVPGISQLARVSGHAVVSPGEWGGVWLRFRDIAVAGISVPALVLNQLLPSLSFAIPLPPLPYGLRIDQLVPVPRGLEVSGSAQAVVFRRAGAAVDPTS